MNLVDTSGWLEYFFVSLQNKLAMADNLFSEIN
jgi:hypothetical protein